MCKSFSSSKRAVALLMAVRISKLVVAPEQAPDDFSIIDKLGLQVLELNATKVLLQGLHSSS